MIILVIILIIKTTNNHMTINHNNNNTNQNIHNSGSQRWLVSVAIDVRYFGFCLVFWGFV